ncbi:cation transporter [Mycolicibacterium tokaiense]|uniref:Integral membrane protein n=1 Tax=Mycolicibacterium tokaiense TaxID=39695 RepID=A0A378TNN6_9MYCO|nr:cation transporter [Mycolicibacterium tokaiense]STZ62319.1 integral membrane protein [Mycolicibacterium tokaiense]
MASTARGAALTDDRRAVLSRRIRLFVAATISYNVIEAIVALTEGARVSSTALIGFGLDSVVEVSSAAAVAWQFAGRKPEAREKTALRIIAFSFFGLATYVTVDAIRALLGVGEAQHSTIGIVLAALSLVIMPVLSYAQRRAGRELGSLSAVADSKQTLLCTYLSAVLLVGLALNSLFGWSWADPIAGLVIAAIAVREGINAWKGDTCCTAPISAISEPTRARCDCCNDADADSRRPQLRAGEPAAGRREPR